MNWGYDRISFYPHHSYDQRQAQIPVLTFSINRISKQQPCIANSWPVISEKEMDSKCVDNQCGANTVKNALTQKKWMSLANCLWKVFFFSQNNTKILHDTNIEKRQWGHLIKGFFWEHMCDQEFSCKSVHQIEHLLYSCGNFWIILAVIESSKMDSKWTFTVYGPFLVSLTT